MFVPSVVFLNPLSLSLILEMAKHIQTKASTNPEESSHVFPQIIFALRDFSLDLEVNGKEVTSDEYMEHCLELKSSSDDDEEETQDRIRRYNQPRLCIRQCFKERKCFTFDRPTSRKKLPYLDTMAAAKLSEEFVEEVEMFCDFVYENTPTKALDNGHLVNGGSE